MPLELARDRHDDVAGGVVVQRRSPVADDHGCCGPAHPHRPAEPQPSPDRDRRPHPDGASTSGTIERDRRGVVLVDVTGAGRWVTDADLGVQCERHPEHVESSAQVRRRGRHANRPPIGHES